MKIYYAHCMAIYGTPQETRDLLFLKDLFGDHPDLEIVNPNSDRINARCLAARLKFKKKVSAGGYIMNKIFKPLVLSCDAVAFRSLPDGRIPAGVFKEIEWAQRANKLVFELPSNILGRVLPVDQTKQYLREIGQR